VPALRTHHAQRLLRPAVVIGALLALLGYGITPSTAATTANLSVSAAISQQNGSVGTVEGYVVGQPTAANTVIRSSFTADTALALADSASTTSAGSMLYVQIPAGFRSQYGLQSNPALIGTKIAVTGTLTPYFTPHAGLKNPTAFTGADGSDPGDPGDPPDPGDYYAAAAGKSGAALKAALHTIISNQTKLTYDQVWNALKDTDQDPANTNNVILLYSGRSQSKSSNGGGVNDWNREHVWAKSHGDFGTATGPGTDVHHLRPEDVSVNGVRGNLDFDNGGTAVAECPGCTSDSDSFDPRPAVRGDIARMIFYMAVRYEGGDGFPNLEPNNSVNNGTAPFIGKLSVLKAWSTADPPDAFEKRRNQVIFDTWQHNRNPFIDHPEWVTSVWP
jgi:endonuclease I